MKAIFRIPAWTWVLLLSAFAAFLQAEEADQRDSLSQAELEQLLAPVALYPDTVLSQLLMAATYPLEVVKAARWSRDHPELSGEAAVDATEEESWDPSVKALVAFPDLLQRMNDDLDWIEKVGDAFLEDQEGVLDSVQSLRQQAYEAGSLDDLEHLSASRQEHHIVIEPVVREVVYIPYYDTTRIYGAWRWSDYPPCRWDRHYHGHGLHRRVYWSPGIHLSWHFFFSAFRWDHRQIVVIDHGYRREHYPHYRRHGDSYRISHHQNARRWEHHGHRPRRDRSTRAWKDAHLVRWPALRNGRPNPGAQQRVPTGTIHPGQPVRLQSGAAAGRSNPARSVERGRIRVEKENRSLKAGIGNPGPKLHRGSSKRSGQRSQGLSRQNIRLR